MKKLFTLICLMIISSTFLLAQNKKYTMQEAILGLRRSLAPENIRQTSFIPGSNAFTMLVNTDENPALLKVKVPEMEKDTIFTLSNINEQIAEFDTLTSMPGIHWASASSVYFKVGRDFYVGLRINGKWTFKKWVTLPSGMGTYYVDEEKGQIAYTRGNDLYLVNAEGETTAISDEENEEISYGQVVSRYEFGIMSGVFFSPKGNYVAFYRMDETDVNDYPIINWEEVPAEEFTIKYPMAGTGSQEVWLGIYNPKTEKTVYMKTGRNTDHYLTNVTWGPDEKYIYIGILNRDQNHLKLNKYNAHTGELVKTLFEERDKEYVHPMEPLSFIPGHDNQFIWWSERDGYQHLYRYNTDGKLLNQVTSGDWVVNSIEGWNTERNEIIITSAAVSPMNRDIFAVNWETGRIRRLDKVDGMHYATVNDGGTYYIDRYSNYSTPHAIRVASTFNHWEETLLDAENPLSDYAQPTVKQMTITAADGHTPLYARLILPPDFDETKKYPVIVYLYNGPGVQLLHNRFPPSGKLWYDYMAQRGYIIFTMDGRGSTNRGVEFEQVTFRDLGTIEMKDQLKGVEYLKSLPYVDTTRMGVHGWSYGGFMTISLMLRHPGVFQCAVAGGPVIDWRMYEVMYTERYMDTPQKNPKGYNRSSLLDKVENLEGDLLVIHGAMDSTVVWQHSMRFLHSCIQHGVQVDYFVYPSHPHNVRGNDRVHLMQKVTDYFDLHLKGIKE